MAVVNQTRQASSASNFGGDPAHPWNDTGYIGASDDLHTYSFLGIGNSSDVLVVSFPGFSIPLQSDIVGVEVNIERHSGTSYTGYTNSINFFKGLFSAGNAKGPGSGWTNGDNSELWGGNGDMWGFNKTSLTPADCNAGLGALLQVHCLNQVDAYHVDTMYISVWYQALNPQYMIL